MAKPTVLKMGLNRLEYDSFYKYLSPTKKEGEKKYGRVISLKTFFLGWAELYEKCCFNRSLFERMRRQTVRDKGFFDSTPRTKYNRC